MTIGNRRVRTHAQARICREARPDLAEGDLAVASGHHQGGRSPRLGQVVELDGHVADTRERLHGNRTERKAVCDLAEQLEVFTIDTADHRAPEIPERGPATDGAIEPAGL